MKKGLSILLVAAALFGFYGSAVNLNDILACKDYWEEEGEKSTANLNKLEDGLNQLKDNEQAYLDGKEQVADGEKALADAEQQLADGEAQLEAGRAELAKGEADYAAAPAKLADAKKKIEKGEKDLADGEKKLADGYDAYNAGKKALDDGKKAVKDGEKKLADGYDAYDAGKKALDDGKKAVKDGEKKLADAADQLEQGEKDLAAGKEQVADGEKALEEGQEALDGLTKLIEGIQTILDGYDEWKPGYDKLADGRNQLYEGTKGMKDKMLQLAAFLPTEAEQKAFKDAVEDVAGDDEKQAAEDYKDFIKSTNTLEKAVPKIQKAVEKTYTDASNLLKLLKAQDDNFSFIKTVKENKTDMLALASLITDKNKKQQYTDGIDALIKAYDGFDSAVEANMDNGWAQFFAMEEAKDDEGAVGEAKKGIALAKWQEAYKAGDQKAKPADATELGQFNAILSKITTEIAENYIKENSAEAQAGVKAAVEKSVKAAYNSADEYPGNQLTPGKAAMIADVDAKTGEGGAVSLIVAALKEANDILQSDKVNKELLGGLKQFNEATKDDEDGVSPIDKLTDGQDQLAGGVSQIASAVLGNKTLRAGVKKNLGKDAIKLLNTYKNSTNPLSSSVSDFAKFEGQMDTNPNLVDSLKKAQALLKQTKADGEKSLKDGKKKLAAGKKAVTEGEAALKAGYAEYEKGKKDLAAGKKEVKEGESKLAAAAKQLKQGEKDLAAGKKKLASGKAQYAQGLKDYAAAPGKLAAGRAKLAEGEAQLADGYRQYDEGKQALADGKAQLAQYEDGEQQVRDGLATLTNTEADLDLVSIADRLNGDVNFDNEDGHLNLEKGLNAVEVGREYQSDDGDLITKEITARAVGTAGLLGAGVLAVLAAILSFLKKNKGAGICAILAAVAGAFGAFYGTQAGTYFSSIAGSTVGATGWIAAGLLGAVALVHAIAHFTAKTEA